MQAFPHHYSASASGRSEGDIELTGHRLPLLRSASPVEFDGPGDLWSPETLLVGAVADCFILTFRAIARAAALPWIALECNATGTLERIDRVTQFTQFDLRVRLSLPHGQDADRARHALEKAERNCLISSSLKGTVRLIADIEVAEPLEAPVAGS
jgi:organic hydroperoxide reductase OsmC/OhrA